MSRSAMSLLTLALCGAAVVTGQTMLSWTASADTGDVALPDLHGIDALQFAGHGDVRIVTDTTPSLTISGGTGSKIKVSREGTKLVIEVKGWFTGQPKFVLHTAPLSSLQLSGSVELEADQLAGAEVRIATSGATEAKVAKVSAPVVRIHGSGSTELTVAAVAADKLEVDSSGSTEIKLTGVAREQDAHFSGSSDYDALGLVSDRVALRLSGSSEAKVHAVKQLVLQASGGSDVEYAGDPAIEQHTSGSSELHRVSG